MTESPLMPTYPPPAVTFVRGAGTELWDVDGTRYLDFLSGLAVVGLGHANPVVAEAVCEQAATLCHVSNLFGTTVGPEVARTLDELIRSGAHDAPPEGPGGHTGGGAPRASAYFLVSAKISAISSMRSSSCWPTASSLVFLASPAALVARQNRSWSCGNCSTCGGLK